MTQPSILKAKKSDCPHLRDLDNFVKPWASVKWYSIGLQLFNPKYVEILTNMRVHASRSPDDNLIDVFTHWLATDGNPTWQKLIDALKCQAVNLPNVAKNIEKMLGGSAFQKGYRKVKSFIKGNQPVQLQPVPEYRSVNNNDPEGRSTFYLSHDDGVKSSYDGVEYETPPSYSGRNTTLPRSSSQQQFNLSSRPPRERSASTGENPLGHNLRAYSLSGLDQQDRIDNFSPGWTSADPSLNSNDSICQALENSCKEMIGELQQKFGRTLAEQNEKIQSIEMLLKQCTADLQQQLDNTESSVNKKSEESVNDLQQQIDKLEHMVRVKMLEKNTDYNKTDIKDKEIQRELQSTKQKLKDEHDRKLREIQDKNALDIKRLQEKFDREQEITQQELSETKRQYTILKENYNKVVIKNQNLQNALEQFQSEIGKQNLKLYTETVAKITDTSPKNNLAKAVPKVTGTPAETKEILMADPCSISPRVTGTDVTKRKAKFTKTPAKDNYSQTLENSTETAMKTKNFAKTPASFTIPMKKVQNPAIVTKPPAIVTKPPAIVTEPPAIVTEPPAMVTKPPNIVTKPPAIVTKPPAIVTEPPAIVTKPPAIVTKPPAIVTKPPAIVTEPPAMVTKPPAIVTEPPAMVTKLPTVVPPVILTMVAKIPELAATTPPMPSSMVPTTPPITPAMVSSMVTTTPVMPSAMVTKTPEMVRVTRLSTVVPPVVSTMVAKTPATATITTAMVPTVITKALEASDTVIAIQSKEPLTTKSQLTENSKEHQIDGYSFDKSPPGVLQSIPSVPKISSCVSQSSSTVPPSPPNVPESPSTVPQSPPSVPQSPSTEPQSLSTEPQSPSTEPQSPSTEPQSPSTEPQSLSTEPQSPSTEPQSPSTEPQSPSTEPQSPSVNTRFGPRFTSARPKNVVQDEKQSTNNHGANNQLEELLAKRRAKNSNPNALQEFEESVSKTMKESRANAKQKEGGKYFKEQPGDRGIESELFKKLQQRMNKS